MNKKILIVEDEVKIASLLQDYLQQSQYDTHTILHGDEVMPWLAKSKPDLILLDIMLPGKDGLTLFREIRQASNIPIIFLTARVDEIDRLLGLELGADDYICKPFSPREVVARVKAVLRRVSSQAVVDTTLTLDENTYKVNYQGQVLELTAVEFQLFKVMYDRPGQIFSRQKLMDSIYNDHRIVSSRTIDSHIKKLRKKFHRVNDKEDIIYSVYGVGYKYEVSV
ncbi:MAG: response regulator [Gammaproteobacteria bacterium]|nr:response regulator [Gammaproteobacteria bacterium]